MVGSLACTDSAVLCTRMICLPPCLQDGLKTTSTHSLYKKTLYALHSVLCALFLMLWTLHSVLCNLSSESRYAWHCIHLNYFDLIWVGKRSNNSCQITDPSPVEDNYDLVKERSSTSCHLRKEKTPGTGTVVDVCILTYQRAYMHCTHIYIHLITTTQAQEGWIRACRSTTTQAQEGQIRARSTQACISKSV